MTTIFFRAALATSLSILAAGCAHDRGAAYFEPEPDVIRHAGAGGRPVANSEVQATVRATSRADGENISDVPTSAGVSGSAMQSGDTVSVSGSNALSGNLAATSRSDSSNQVFASSIPSAEQPDIEPRGQTGIDVIVQGSSAVDRTLAQQISQELRADASLASAVSRVSISIEDGRVTLRGTVKNVEQKREIESVIQRSTGVSSVDNQLVVGEPAPRDP